jgi:hypothetical protein
LGAGRRHQICRPADRPELIARSGRDSGSAAASRRATARPDHAGGVRRCAGIGRRYPLAVFPLAYFGLLAVLLGALVPVARTTRSSVAAVQQRWAPAQVAARGFVITRDSEFLGPYNQGGHAADALWAACSRCCRTAPINAG